MIISFISKGENISNDSIIRMYVIINDTNFISSVNDQNLSNIRLIKKQLETGEDSIILLSTNITKYNTVLSNYSIYKFHQAFPTAGSAYLKNVYYIEANSEDVAFELQKTLGIDKIPTIDVLCEPSLVYTPNDYSIYHDLGDYYYLDVIHAKEAWDIVKDSSKVKVALTDTYFDTIHEDIQFEEIRGSNNNYSSYHGTSVAGLISATNNNNKGIASIGGYNTELTASSNWGNDNEILILAQNGHRVINCSWINGCTYSEIRDTLYKEIRKIWNAVVVCGAGNNAENCGSLGAKVYPASYENCVSVTGVSHLFNHGYLDENGGKKYWIDVHEVYAGNNEKAHHHNDAVDICAPAWYIKSTDLSGSAGWSPDNYAHYNGTSYAAPIVSGVAAIIIAANPCLSADGVVEVLLESADKSIYDISYNEPYIGMLGTGRVDAYAAVLKAQKLYSPTLDLYIKDRPEDLGITPWGYDWQAARDSSPDIWIRNQPDGRSNFTHQSPEYDPNQPVYVYVRVRNKSCSTSVGTEQLKVYWSKAASTASWPDNWDGTNPSIGNLIGTANIGEILPGRDSIYEFTWNIYNTFQNGNWLQCVLARIENSTTDTIIIYPERLDDDVYFNNNIAVKNLSIVDMVPNTSNNTCGGYIYIGNSTPQEAIMDLRFNETTQNAEDILLDAVNITVSFDSVGWTEMSQYFLNNSQIEIIGDRKIKILSKDLTIENIYYPANTRYPILIEFEGIGSSKIEQKNFNYNVVEYLVDSLGNHILGGMHYSINLPKDLYFEAKTEKEIIKVNLGTPVNLSAISQTGSFEYNWYDNIGNLVGTGTNINISCPSESTTYQLQVMSDKFCYSDYSNITILVNPNYIVSISPNPANTSISVEYRLSTTVTVAEFVIVNQLGIVQITQPININRVKQDIYVGQLPAGVYTVKLKVNNEISDSKTFIKQ